MTSLTEKMEGLFQNEHPVDCIDGETPVETYGYEETYNGAVRDCIALVDAETSSLPITAGSANLSVIPGYNKANGIEEAVVGDWEAEFDKKWLGFNEQCEKHPSRALSALLPVLKSDHEKTKQFITTLLADKDREREKAVTETIQEVMDWAMDNGITDKKSFCALRDYLTEKAIT